jgi:hypothetical protein
MDLKQQTRYSYLVTAIGVGLMAVSAVFGAVRAILFRDMFLSRGGFGGGPRQFGSPNPFGFANGPAVLAVVLGIVGLVWLGLALRKTPKTAPA